MTHAHELQIEPQSGLLGLYQELHLLRVTRADMIERQMNVQSRVKAHEDKLLSGEELGLNPTARLDMGDDWILSIKLRGRVAREKALYDEIRSKIEAFIAPRIGSTVVIRSIDPAKPVIRLGIENDAPLSSEETGILQPYGSEDRNQLRLTQFQRTESTQLWAPVIDEETANPLITIEF